MKTKKIKIALFTAVIFSFFVLNIYSAQASFLSDANSFFNNIFGKIQKISIDLGKIFANEEGTGVVGVNAETKPKVKETFNGVLTHPNFWSRDGQQAVGKRYLGTMSNAAKYGSQFMKFWSFILNSDTERGNREVAFQKYFGWDDESNVIYE